MSVTKIKTRIPVALLGVSLGLVALTGCSGDRPCLRGHYDAEIVPIYSYTGKTTTTTWIPEQVWNCDEYAPDTPSPTPTATQ